MQKMPPSISRPRSAVLWSAKRGRACLARSNSPSRRSRRASSARCVASTESARCDASACRALSWKNREETFLSNR
eukprot:1605314-Pyramimonas_sp.AAC.1